MRNKLIVRANGKLYAVPLDEIIFMEKNLRKIKLHTVRGSIVFYGKFNEIMDYLDERFLHCHQSYVLNMDEIMCMGRDEIVMSDDSVMRFGQKCYERARKTYEGYIQRFVVKKPEKPL